MPLKSKVYGRSKRKKDDDFCAAFQELQLSTPVQAPDGNAREDSRKNVAENREGRIGERILSKVDEEMVSERRAKESNRLDSKKADTLNSSKAVMEDVVPVMEPKAKSTNAISRQAHCSFMKLNPFPAEHDLITTEPVQVKKIAKGSCQEDVTCKVMQKGSRRLRSTKAGKVTTRYSSTLISDSETLSYLSPLTNIAGVRSTIKATEQWYQEWTTLCDVTKIAEGSYGSVFRLSDREGVQEATIGKLMPLKSKSGKGSRKAGSTHVADAASEVLLLESMSHVPGFVEFRNAEVLIGAIPQALRKEYRAYEKQKKNKSDVECPPCEVSYPDTQLWVFIEMGDAGTELENALRWGTQENQLVQMDAQGHVILSAQQTRDVFWETADALACGEEAQEFEHRDLHFSNICIKERGGASEGYLLVPKATSMEVTLIDYTLSRTTLSDGSTVSNKMTDAEIFKAEGDLQFEVYRWMRDAMPGTDIKHKDWEAYVPLTNVLWLYHLLAKLLQQTPRPVEHHEEELWDLLNQLKCDIDPNDRSNRKVLSARDVVSYAQKGRSHYLKEIAERKTINCKKDDISQMVKTTSRMRIR